uniref:Transcription factor HES-5 n=1 Tax=Leptobrachium leishanense TaxID=445787 RepID=A0A8C5MIN9_9ANUR
MAPSSTGMMQADANGHRAPGMRKLRKPVIEKMRRDRINSSIEQLRMLLEEEFQKQQLPSKPEKADILEMTVTFLQQHLQAGKSKCPALCLLYITHKSLSGNDRNEQTSLIYSFSSLLAAPSSHQSYREGYSRCVQDSEHFLSQHRNTEVQEKLLQNIHWTQAVTEERKSPELSLKQTPSKHLAPGTTKAIWRPW